MRTRRVAATSFSVVSCVDSGPFGSSLLSPGSSQRARLSPARCTTRWWTAWPQWSSACCSSTAAPRKTARPMSQRAEEARLHGAHVDHVSSTRVAAGAAADIALQQFRLARGMLRAGLEPGRTVRIADTMRRAAFALAENMAIRPAPATLLNVPIGPRRALYTARFPVERLNELKRRSGAKLNDVLLAAAAGPSRLRARTSPSAPPRARRPAPLRFSSPARRARPARCTRSHHAQRSLRSPPLAPRAPRSTPLSHSPHRSPHPPHLPPTPTLALPHLHAHLHFPPPPSPPSLERDA